MDSKMTINILTRCSRPENLHLLEKSIVNEDINVKWKIAFDTSRVSNIDTQVFERYSKYSLNFWKGEPGDMGHAFINKFIDEIPDDEWIYILDDDNLLHPEFYTEILELIKNNPEKSGFIFSQFIGGKDFTKQEVREAKEENVKVQHIDMAQFFLKKSLISDKRLVSGTYVADGIFIEELFNENKDKFLIYDKILCYYNSLQTTSKSYSLPRVVVSGSDNIELKSKKLFEYESDDLNVVITDQDTIIKTINDHDPDCILTFGESFNDYPSLKMLSPDIRLRWVHMESNAEAGEVAYRCAMNYILKSSIENEIVSIFTPVYNTGEKLFRTYSSIAAQTYDNWEWVIVDDSTDEKTSKIVKKIASRDPRVKVYTFNEKSKGVIGEVKYRACSLSRGKYLVELDHDDFLLPHAIAKIVEGFTAFPDAGFVYTDCAEINEDHTSLMYGEGFAMGYGSYRSETHLGREYQIAVTPNINPATIRHIVGVPNHIRAWRKDIYHAIGGHNRRLTIADDYELVIRTFLATKMVRIPMGCYLQFQYGGNTQNAARADIQRRVRTISDFYNNQIKERFEELGKIDWAHGKNFRSFPIKTGDEEQYVNYILE
jgi:glycosyltransferase involved in cell wall biosynthesis